MNEELTYMKALLIEALLLAAACGCRRTVTPSPTVARA